MEREFRLDIDAFERIERKLESGSLLSIAQELLTGSIKFAEVCLILFETRVTKDAVSYEVWRKAIADAGFTKYVGLVGDLLLDFFQPPSAAVPSAETEAPQAK